MTSTAVSPFLQRLIGAASLDAATYEDVEANRTATTEAFLVVLASSLAAGLGARGWGSVTMANVLFISSVALMAWAAWALVILAVGGYLMPEPQTRVDVGELLRTLGFATAPGMLRVFGIIPGVTLPVFAIAAVWMLFAMVIAVRQALDYRGTARAIGVCVLGWLLAIAVAVALGLFFGPTVA